MPTVFSEEDLYDVGLEPLAIEDENRLFNIFSSYIEHPVRMLGSKGGRLPVYPVTGVTVPFPGQVIQLQTTSPMEMHMSRQSFENKTTVFLGLAMDGCFVSDPAVPSFKRVAETGVLAQVVGFAPEPSHNSANVTLITGLQAKIVIEETEKLDAPHPFEGYIKPLKEERIPTSERFRKETDELQTKFKLLLEALDMPESKLLLQMLGICEDRRRILNFIAMHLPARRSLKYDLFSMPDWLSRVEMMGSLLDEAFMELRVRQEVIAKANEQMSQQSRDNYLRSQMDAIRTELGEGFDENSDITELRERSATKEWGEQVAKHFSKELKKLERYNVSMPEYSIQYTYLDTMLNLPWNDCGETDFTLSEVRDALDSDHFGLEKVKERIVEHMAVHKLRSDLKAPILCLAGAPGVGKTSLGRSIAKALGRNYSRIALGGVSDEAEIRGHRKTYVGAMPGRIISALTKTERNNPVFLLDEIDKIGKGLRGDPAQALLEVLDPEQNSTFHDNYLDIDYDLSKVFFIATANSLGDIPAPLLDRMEVLEISGYIAEEKIEIAMRHLFPKALQKNGFGKEEIAMSREGVLYLIENYTRESGVRQLEKKIDSLLRKIAVLKVESRPFPKTIGKDDIISLLGKEEVFREVYEDNSYAGVVTGLAWTSAGGEILFIETSVSKGKGDKLTLTGNLGQVMKESAAISLEYIKAHLDETGLESNSLENADLHLHVPEGAVPKDGPSAGIAMTVSIASALSKRKVRANLAMTGEMTLRGKVLPVGGIKEKILAARRAGIKDIMLSRQNMKDVEEIPLQYVEGLTFHYVDHVSEVLAFSLTEDRAER